MTIPFYHGDQVCFVDSKGQVKARGVIVGTHKVVGGTFIFDLQPDGEKSVKRRICGIPENELKRVDDRVLAYERGPTGPRNIDDHV